MKTLVTLQREANQRNADRVTRSTQHQLVLLDRRPGNASKERKRLSK